MTEKERAQIREKLVSEIARVKQDVENLKEITKPVDTEGMDEITRMDAIVSKSVNDAALAAARSRLGGLEYAFKRLEDDDPEFGYCLECGEAIPLPRLFSMPEASRCVNCAE